MAARQATDSATFNLRSIAPGFRLCSWLAGRSDALWVDGWIGYLILVAAQAVRARVRVAWSGPIGSRVAFGVPVLSWFELPVRGTVQQSFIATLNDVLGKTPSAGLPSDIEALAQRVLAALGGYCGDAVADRAFVPPRTAGTVRVLLIDERVSVRNLCTALPCARHVSFDRMVAEAMARHSDGEFWLLRSVDAGAGGWLSSRASALPPNVRLVSDRHSVLSCLDQMDHVYTVSASEGMLALIADVPVHVFGGPYYAGWGLTDDYFPLPGRSARPTVAELFHALFVKLPRYIDPFTHQPGNIESVLDSIELQHDLARRFEDLRHVAAVGFQWWKRSFAAPFLMAGQGSLRWTASPQSVTTSEYAAVWGGRSTIGLPPDARHIRVEDGFLHSSGLGSDLSAPKSLVIDRRGIYFDPTGPSELTALLNNTAFSATELARASALRERIVECGLTKYNLGRRRPQWKCPNGTKVVLIPGQVADDASVRLGSSTIKNMAALLREVRAQRPTAWLVYRPHPDVLSGNRVGLVDASGIADVIDTSSDIVSLIEVADEVHTLSSLTGFDALLRGKTVFTYGMPFYAGWGLTRDAVAPIPWRERTLSLDQFTAGVMLRYPLYWDWRLNLYTTPEAIVRELANDASRPLGPIRATPARSAMKVWRWLRNVSSHALWRWLQRGKSVRPAKRPG